MKRGTRRACPLAPLATSPPPPTLLPTQELLEHPFLRPTHAPAPAPAKPSGSSVELSREQLTKLLQQVAAAGMSGGDVGHLSDTLFKQLASGLSPDLVSRKAMAAEQARSVVATQQAQQAQAPQRREAAAPAAQALPQQARAPAPPQPQQPGSVAAAAAQAAGARAGQRADAVAALESRPRAAAAPAACTRSGRAALMPISQTALQQQAASLRRVDPAQKAAPAARQPDSGLEAALRKGGWGPWAWAKLEVGSWAPVGAGGAACLQCPFNQALSLP